jgi:hypothetical protein
MVWRPIPEIPIPDDPEDWALFTQRLTARAGTFDRGMKALDAGNTVFAKKLLQIGIGVYHGTLARTEWLDATAGGACGTTACVLKTGTDVYVRKGTPPALQKRWAAVGDIKVASQLFKWNTAVTPNRWDKIRDSGWYQNTGITDHITPTFNWGTAPGGAAWYSSVGISAHKLANGTFTQVSVSTGSVWDPKPGDDTEPGPKPPNPPKAEKVKEEGPESVSSEVALEPVE